MDIDLAFKNLMWQAADQLKDTPPVGFSNQHWLVSFQIRLVSEHRWHIFLSYFFLKFSAGLMHNRMLTMRWYITKKARCWQPLTKKSSLPGVKKQATHHACSFTLHSPGMHSCCVSAIAVIAAFLHLFLFFCCSLTQTLVSFLSLSVFIIYN